MPLEEINAPLLSKKGCIALGVAPRRVAPHPSPGSLCQKARHDQDEEVNYGRNHEGAADQRVWVSLSQGGPT